MMRWHSGGAALQPLAHCQGPARGLATGPGHFACGCLFKALSNSDGN